MRRKPLKISWRAWCLYKLGKRDYSAFEMRQSLSKRAADSEQTVDVDEVVDKLVFEGIIDDTRYIESQIGMHTGTFGLKGPRELEKKLRIQGGISADLISQYIDPEDRKWYDLAKEHCQKTFFREMDISESGNAVSEKLFFKVKNRLYRKGFTRSQIDFALQGFQPQREVRTENGSGELQRWIEKRMADGRGPYDILPFLRQKGFDKDEIQAQLQYSDEVWVELAAKEREKRFGQGMPKTAKEKRKQIEFLQRRGFQFEHISNVFE